MASTDPLDANVELTQLAHLTETPAHYIPLNDVLEFADLLTPAWAQISAGIPDWHPRNEGDGSGDGDGDGSGDGGDGDGETDWKAETEKVKGESRKHEGRWKSERKLREAAEAKLAEHAAASQTDTEKALEKARKEAAEAAKTEVSGTFQKKLMSAEIRAQAAGKFANPKLAARLLDLDADKVFDADGEVDATAIATAIDDFLKLDENAGLRAAGSTARPGGSADGGKGSGSPKGDMNDFIRAGIGR